ncbi:MAG: conjugal transfer protein TraK, partial [Halomonadaceae bacterium]|nr:conjugal transfer protein TraK [Halomonadaceae bacterium]
AMTIFCMLPLSSAIADAFEDLPGLPITSIQQADAEARVAQASLPQPSEATAGAQLNTPARLITLTPGVNEIIPVAVGHTNRFLVPFDNPRIRTTSNAGFDVEGRAIYVTSNEEGRPVTAFVNEAGNPEVALSLTFVPSRMPPVEVELKLAGDSYAGGLRPSQKAKSWEESQPYVVTLRDLLRDVAVGQTPQGYTLSHSPVLSGFGGCYQQGLHFDFANGQMLDGHRLRVNVGVMENRSNQTIEFREPACAGNEVKAVAAWPKPILKPGEKSEVYVVLGVPSPERVPYNSRRSLLQE